MNMHDPFADLPPADDMPPDDRFGPAHNPFIDDTPQRTSRFFPASDLSGKPVPTRNWLVPDLVPSRVVTSLYGDGGTGKSLLALQLAYAVATEGRWLGRGVSGGRVLFISAEDDEDELHRRLDAIVQTENGRFEDLDRLTLRSLAGEDALLALLDRNTGKLIPSALYAEIDKRVTDDAPALLVLDTLADLFPGNENDRAQVTQFVGLLIGLAVRHDCAVLMLAHPSRSGLASGGGDGGSTAWNGKVRSRLYLERVAQEGYEANPDARMLTTKKANYGRTGGEIALTWRDGVFVADAPETGPDRMAASAKAERVFLKLLRAFTEQGRRVNANGGATYAPKAFAESSEAEGCTKRVLKAAMDSLFHAGKIKNETTGPASRTVTYIVLGDA
ncbi:AAA family ATPase [Paenirhodobacter enshiensis]|uniref:AAA family ATPase n=1 Tax=Paenirhodobacter enshiensis TaxID=1105367 RepID=UPI0035B37F9C